MQVERDSKQVLNKIKHIEDLFCKVHDFANKKLVLGFKKKKERQHSKRQLLAYNAKQCSEKDKTTKLQRRETNFLKLSLIPCHNFRIHNLKNNDFPLGSTRHVVGLFAFLCWDG